MSLLTLTNSRSKVLFLVGNNTTISSSLKFNLLMAFKASKVSELSSICNQQAILGAVSVICYSHSKVFQKHCKCILRPLSIMFCPVDSCGIFPTATANVSQYATYWQPELSPCGSRPVRRNSGPRTRSLLHQTSHPTCSSGSGRSAASR